MSSGGTDSLSVHKTFHCIKNPHINLLPGGASCCKLMMITYAKYMQTKVFMWTDWLHTAQFICVLLYVAIILKLGTHYPCPRAVFTGPVNTGVIFWHPCSINLSINQFISLHAKGIQFTKP